MSTIHERVAVELPAQTALGRLAEYFELLRGFHKELTLAVRVPLYEASNTGIALERDVEATVTLRRDEPNLNYELQLQWDPRAAALPVFAGRLYTWGEDNPSSSFIELEGGYTPPLGALGAAIDTIAGNRIAHRTARELLYRLRDAITDG